MTGLPDPPVSEYEGFEHFWRAEDDRWKAGPFPAMRCRYTLGPNRKACGKPSVAALARGSSRRWWYYCEDHLYGRIIVDGVVYVLNLRRKDVAR